MSSEKLHPYLARYEEAIKRGNLKPDGAQRKAAEALDRLHETIL